ncbi:MAG TPA: CHASE3 domain-containing protein [Chthoniobacter sp.]
MLIPILLLCALGVIVRQSQNALVASSQWVSHTLEVEANLSRLQSSVTDAESAQRSFLFTKRDTYRESFETAAALLPGMRQQLVQLTRDNASQQERLRQLDDVISRRVKGLRGTMELERNGHESEAAKIAASDAGLQLTSQIRTLISDAMRQEGTLLRERQETLTKASSFQTKTSGLLILFAGFTVVTILWLLRRMQKVQALVTVCAWSKAIELDGEWISFEEYLHRRFKLQISHGISPAEAAKFSEELAALRKKVA